MQCGWSRVQSEGTSEDDQTVDLLENRLKDLDIIGNNVTTKAHSA